MLSRNLGQKRLWDLIAAFLILNIMALVKMPGAFAAPLTVAGGGALEQLHLQLKSASPVQARAMVKSFQKQNLCQEKFYVVVAEAYRLRGWYGDARPIIEAGLKFYPESFDLHYLNGQVWMAVAELEMAQPQFEYCLRLRPHSGQVHSILSQFYNERLDFGRALKENDLALAEGVSDVDVWTVRGSILRNLGRLKEAVEALDKAVVLCKHADFNVRKMRAPLLTRLGRYDEAIREYKYLAAVEPTHDFLAFACLGQCYMAQRKPGEALSYFDMAIKRHPDTLTYHQGRLAALTALNRRAEVLEEQKVVHSLEDDFKPIK